MKRPTRWSYSALSTYKGCPAKYKFSYIDNIPWPSSPAMARGTRMHLMAEEFVKGVVPAVHPEIKKIGPLLFDLQQKGAKAEEVWLLNRRWEPVEDQNEAWIKAIIDVHYVIDPILYLKDYKSGQMYPDHLDQLELYGIIGLQKYPNLKRAETSAVYMDQGHEGNEGSIIRPMLSKMIEAWDTAANIMEADEVFEPKPGAACRWCPYAQSKGGPCVY